MLQFILNEYTPNHELIHNPENNSYFLSSQPIDKSIALETDKFVIFDHSLKSRKLSSDFFNLFKN